jgi:hypothetical protein
MRTVYFAMQDAAATDTWASLFAEDTSETKQPPKGPYSYMLSAAQRARGLTYVGSAERLRLALDRALKSESRAA